MLLRLYINVYFKTIKTTQVLDRLIDGLIHFLLFPVVSLVEKLKQKTKQNKTKQRQLLHVSLQTGLAVMKQLDKCKMKQHIHPDSWSQHLLLHAGSISCIDSILWCFVNNALHDLNTLHASAW